MGLGEYVGVHAQGEAGFAFALLGAGGEDGEFGFALDVECEDVGVEGLVDLFDGLADSGEDNAIDGLWGGDEDAMEFSTGDDVKARALACQELQNAKCGIGLDRVTDQMWTSCECALKEGEAGDDLVGAVDVERGAEAIG